jgi:hypothetical protein
MRIGYVEHLLFLVYRRSMLRTSSVKQRIKIVNFHDIFSSTQMYTAYSSHGSLQKPLLSFCTEPK